MIRKIKFAFVVCTGFRELYKFREVGVYVFRIYFYIFFLGIITVSDKVALLIGNKDYDHSEKLGKLYHPTNDVRDIAGVLQSIGFKVGNT